MENNAVKENLDSLFGNLEKFLKTETVVGEPIVVGEVTLVPIISVMFGCGTGGSTGHDNKGMNGTGSGGGGGARITPNAILVIKKDEVTLLPIKEKSNIDNLLNMVPDIVSKLNIKKEKNEETQE
ncbi:GerW family sporulation protein [Clostridium sp.]|uniref:GerW family sporulation protein n=1 Tax=Clostridium sp. TaxID=1506 RepID=UPI002636EF8C|nr:spore germination protein GerW family protein [Clostridium sp.]